MDEEKNIKFVKSSTSCYVDDIKGFIFGASHSRFWMLRKHFCCMPLYELKYAPFFAWQCLTLQLGHRDVDLVIPDQKQMDMFLTFLVHSLKTLDGERDSAVKLLDTLNPISYQMMKKKSDNQKVQ